MKSFREFIVEASTKKQFIQHLDKMPPLKFLELAKRLDKEMGGILSKEHVEIREKMDGAALRIGLNEEGQFFAQSSTSPSFFEVGEFRDRFAKHGLEAAEMGEKWDQILHTFKTDPKIQAILQKYKTPSGIKVTGEIMYPPLGIDLADKLKFVRIEYEKKRLGSEYTYVPFYVMDGEGERHPKEKEIFQAFYDISDDKRKYVDSIILSDTEIDISTDLQAVQDNIVQKYDNLEAVLTSRKKIDKELKEKIKGELLELQHKLAQKILSYAGGGLLSKDIEGIVIELSDGSILKIVSDKFKDSASTIKKK